MSDQDRVERLVGLAMGRSAALCYAEDGDLPSRPWPQEHSDVTEAAWLEGWNDWHASHSGPDFEGKGGPGEHRTVGSVRAWCLDCHEWCYASDDAGCACCERWEERLEQAEARVLEAVQLVDAMVDAWPDDDVGFDRAFAALRDYADEHRSKR